MARRYGTYTPRRAAALRKAQLASARKRRGRHLAIAGGVGVIGATAAAGAVLGVRYTQALKGGPKPYVSKSKELDLVRVTRLGAHTGMPMRRVGLRTNKTQKGIDKFDRAARKAAQNVAHQKYRAKYNQNRRRAYWQAKPVKMGKPNMPIATRGSIRAGMKRRKRG